MNEKKTSSSASSEPVDPESASTPVVDVSAEAPTSEIEAQAPGSDSPEDSPDDPGAATQKLSQEPENGPVTKIKSGRVLAWLAILLALAGVIGAGYLYYRLIYVEPFAALEQELASDATTMADLQARITSLAQHQQEALADASALQQANLAAAKAALADSLNNVVRSAPPSQNQWKIAEVEYLLRIANHRVLLEADTGSALRLLEMADGILLEIDDFGLHQVRAELADEMLALKRVAPDDLQGLFLRIEAIKGRLEGLPLLVPDYLQPGQRTEAVASADQSIWAMVGDRLKAFVQFRTLETELKPLMAPEEATYLELNLRLMLEQAQLAALRRHQVVYDQSLATAGDWVARYLAGADPAVQSVQSEIQALAGMRLERQLPDISGSLRALKASERGVP